MLVSTVTAMTRGGVRPSFDAVSCAASRAACIMRDPPDACTLSIQTPSEAAAAVACATVLGMSWNFRSRKTRSPRDVKARTIEGPSDVKRRLPILKPPATPLRLSASAIALALDSTSSAIRS